MKKSAPVASLVPLLSVAEAQAILLSAAKNAPLLDALPIATLHANKRILAADVIAKINVPGDENAQMDGYALHSRDAIGSQSLLISQRIAAGHVGQTLQAGTVARIFTGATLPDGADCVIMQEQCELVEGDLGQSMQNSMPKSVRLLHIPKAGEWVRHVGEDIRAGSVILRSGMRLRAQDLGLAASVGLGELTVRRPLNVALFFTGDELVMPGEPLPAGGVYNSNRFLLTALLENLGCRVVDFGIVPDNLVATRNALRQASKDNDVVITSGGVSVGEEDHVKPAVQAEGQLDLWKIAVKPGKPLAFGRVGSAFFLGLPGNPVSSFVTFLLFVRPFLLQLQGANDVMPKLSSMRADFAWPKADKRNEFLRVKCNDQGGLDLFPNQGSAVLSSAVWGDGLVDVPVNTTIQPGDRVTYLSFSELLS